jgi:hypothetical protein
LLPAVVRLLRRKLLVLRLPPGLGAGLRRLRHR